MTGKKQDLTPVPIAAAEVLVDVTQARPAVYLPGQDGKEPVLYRQEGTAILRPDFTRLKESGVHVILVRGEELDKYEAVLEENLAKLLHDNSVPAEQKAACVQQVGTAVARELIEGDNTAEGLDRASALLDNVIDGVLADRAVATNLLQMSGHHQSTASHMFAVGTLGIILAAEAFGEESQSLKEVGLAGMLHDLGKLQVDVSILNKTTPLTPEEIRLIQQHPIESVRLLEENPVATDPVRQMILQHHERYDGRGYPLGLAGDELLPGSKVLSIVDSFHALIGKRVYRRGTTPAEAIRLLSYQRGKQFDPELYARWVELFSRCWQAQATIPPIHLDLMDVGHSFHADHRPEKGQGIPRQQARLSCQGRASVKCLYVGQLSGPGKSQHEQVLPLHDLSKGGLCVYSARPMYRGEVLHMFLKAGQKHVWIRGLVAWCRRELGRQGYRAGIRFVARISPDEAALPVPVTGMDDPRMFGGVGASIIE